MIRVFTEQPFILFFVSELEDMRQNDRHNIQASLWMSLESQRLVLSTAVARLIYTLEDPSMGFAVWDRRRRRLRNAVRRPHRDRFLAIFIASGSVKLWDFRSCCMVLSHVMRGRPRGLLQSSGGRLTGSSWHLRYRPYAQCVQKVSGHVIRLLQ